MNSDTCIQKKRKAFDTPIDPDNINGSQPQYLMCASPLIGNLQQQQQSSASNFINGGVDVHHSQPHDQFLHGNVQQQPSSCINDDGVDGSVNWCPCVNCHCGRHEAITVEGDYLDSLPLGYRFVPTDEELFSYLDKKIHNEKLPKTKISEAPIYGDHPEDLVVKYPQAIEDGWYFFTTRSRKYPNGGRPDRQAGSGYWKATGPDKVYKDNNGAKIGGRKSLVYYEGHAPHWTKTKWMMHEYVIEGHKTNPLNSKDKEFNDYVLSKIYINGRMKDEIATTDHQQSRTANNIDNGNITSDHIPVETEQALVPYQPVEDSENVVLMVPDQHERVVSNQEVINPTGFRVDNNMNYHVENSLISMRSNQHINHSVENGVKEAKRENVVGDHVVNQVKNNMIMPPCLRFIDQFQVKSYQELLNPSMDHDSSSSLRFGSYFVPTGLTPQHPHTLPSHALNIQAHPMSYWFGSNNNQVAPGFQEGGHDHGDPAQSLRESIERMYIRDGYDGFLDDDDQFQYECLSDNLEVDDESQKN